MAALVVSLLLSVAMSIHVSAHAEQERTIPEAGASLATPPTKVEIWFTEEVVPNVSKITLYDAAHHPVETGPAQVDPSDAKHMILDVPKLAPGFYTVVWSNLAADDGHANSGGFGFSIAAPASTTPAASQATAIAQPVNSTTSSAGRSATAPSLAQDQLTQLGVLITSWIVYLALIFLAGGSAFWLWCVTPVMGEDGESTRLRELVRRRLISVMAVAALAGAVADVGVLLLNLYLAAGEISRTTLLSDLASRSGTIWIAQELTFLAASALWLVSRSGMKLPLAKSSRGLGQPFAGMLLGVAGLILQVSNSHLAAGHVARTGPLGTVALTIHLLAIALWVGGLGCASLVLMPLWRQAPPPLRGDIGRRVVARFSTLALASVVTIVLTGSYVAVLMIPEPRDLIASSYGRILLVKVVLLLVLIGFGVANRRTLAAGARLATDHNSERSQRAWRLLVSMRREYIVAGVVVLAASGMLVAGPPTSTLPQSAISLQSSATLPGIAGPSAATVTDFSGTMRANDLQVTLSIDTVVAGQVSTFRVAVTDSSGAPVTPSGVKLSLTSQSLDVGTQVLTLNETAPGQFRAAGPIFSTPGSWQVQTVVSRDHTADAQANFVVTAQSPEPASATAIPAPAPYVIQARLVLTPYPPHVGADTATIELFDASNQPVNSAQLQGSWLMPQHSHRADTTFQPMPSAPGSYEGRVSFIMAGAWVGQVTVHLADGRQAALPFAFNVSGVAPAWRGSSSEMALGLILALLSAAGAALVLVRRTSRIAPRYALSVAAALLLVSCTFLVDAVASSRAANASNPIRPTAASIQRGRQIYSQNCVSCHGATAHGDGPLAATLNPVPADLTVHVNAHPDATLFDWISNGVPGSAMPAFKSVISTQDRWNLLNYLHSLAQAPAIPVAVPAKRIPSAAGTIIWAQGNTIVGFDPARGTQSNLVTLPSGSQVSDPALSPDGKWFVVRLVQPGGNPFTDIDLYLVPNQGGSARLLLGHQSVPGVISTPTWSPDGKEIYFGVGNELDPANSRIERVSSSGGPAEEVTTGSEPALSPDGSTLIFVRATATNRDNELWRANPDGSQARAIPGGRFVGILSPVVSPDGSTVAFTATGRPLPQPATAGRLKEILFPSASAHGGNWEAWTLPLSGGEATERSNVQENQPLVRWSPDGRWVTVTGDLGLYVVDLSQQKTYLFDLTVGSGLGWLNAP